MLGKRRLVRNLDRPGSARGAAADVVEEIGTSDLAGYGGVSGRHRRRSCRYATRASPDESFPVPDEMRTRP